MFELHCNDFDISELDVEIVDVSEDRNFGPMEDYHLKIFGFEGEQQITLSQQTSFRASLMEDFDVDELYE